ncbi:hypothetical protein Tco_0805600 [Tanacetum coccineum]
MFNDVKLQVDYECEMAFELLRLVKKQLKEGYGRIIRIQRLLDDLEVTADKLMLPVYKLLLLVLKVNAASTKVTTAQRLRLLKEFLLLKKLKYHLGKFDTVVKKRITPDAITEGEWGFEHAKKVFNEEVIPFKNSLQTLVKDFENGLLNELNEVKTVFNQMEAAVDQCSVDKKLFEIEKKELKLENKRLLEHIICQDVVNIVMHADDKFVNVLPVQNIFLNDNISLDMMKMENDRLMELLVSLDMVHTAVNSISSTLTWKYTL